MTRAYPSSLVRVDIRPEAIHAHTTLTKNAIPHARKGCLPTRNLATCHHHQQHHQERNPKTLIFVCPALRAESQERRIGFGSDEEDREYY